MSSLWQTLSSTDSCEDLGAIHRIGAPIHVYPLYENAFRAHRGQTPNANHQESAKLYAEFSEVAKNNEYAWNYGSSSSEEEIGTVGKRNRMICHPCTPSFFLLWERPLTSDPCRSPAYECFQHGQPRLCHYSYFNFFRQRTRGIRVKMDISTWWRRNEGCGRVLEKTELLLLA